MVVKGANRQPILSQRPIGPRSGASALGLLVCVWPADACAGWLHLWAHLSSGGLLGDNGSCMLKTWLVGGLDEFVGRVAEWWVG